MQGQGKEGEEGNLHVYATTIYMMQHLYNLVDLQNIHLWISHQMYMYIGVCWHTTVSMLN